MRYRVRLLLGDGPTFDVELPPLRPGEPATALVDGRPVEVVLLEAGGDAVLSVGGARHPLSELPAAAGAEPGGTEVRFLHRGFPLSARVESEIDVLRSTASRAVGGGGPVTISSPLPGVVRRVLATPGTPVETETPLFTLEAMKMENEVRAGRRGRVTAVLVAPGQVVAGGQALAQIETG